jgi:hypothetical protein
MNTYRVVFVREVIQEMQAMSTAEAGQKAKNIATNNKGIRLLEVRRTHPDPVELPPVA